MFILHTKWTWCKFWENEIFFEVSGQTSTSLFKGVGYVCVHHMPTSSGK